ncbi:MAG: transglutaminase domain-containing protein [Nitrospirota bacterium]
MAIPREIQKNAVKIRDLIKKYGVNKEIRRLTTKILSKKDSRGNWNVAEKDRIGEANAVLKWVRRKVRYTNDPVGKDIYESPFETLEMGIGDCDAFTILIGAMLNSIGHKVKPKLVRQKNLYHIYLIDEIKDNSKGINGTLAIDGSFSIPIGTEIEYDESIVID